MTDVISSVGPGKTYETLTTWLAAMKSGSGTNLVSAQERWIAELYGEIEDNFTLSGITTSSTYYPFIRPAPSYCHYGKWSHGPVLKQAAGSDLFVVDAASTADLYLTVEGVTFLVNSGVSNALYCTGTANLVTAVLDKCFFLCTANGDHLVVANLKAAVKLLSTCFFAYGLTAGKSCARAQGGSGAVVPSLSLANCTIIGSGGDGVSIHAAGGESGSATVGNCAFSEVVGTELLQAGGGGTEAFTMGSNYGNDTASGVTVATTPEMRFVSTVQGDEDAHILEDSPLVSSGEDLNALFGAVDHQDMDWDYRLLIGGDETWSIGADQRVEHCGKLSPSRTSEAALLRQFEHGVSYDGSTSAPTYAWNRQMSRIDRLLSLMEDKNTSIATTISGLQSNSSVLTRTLCLNGNFDRWDYGTSFVTSDVGYTADAWYKFAGTVVAREASQSAGTMYGLKLTPSQTGVNAYVVQKLVFDASLNTATLSFSCDVVCSAVSTARIGIKIGSGSISYSSYHNGDGTTQRLIVTATVPSSSTSVLLYLQLNNPSSTSVTGSFAQVACARGQFSSLPYVPATDPAHERCSIATRQQLLEEIWLPTSELEVGVYFMFPIFPTIKIEDPITSYNGTVGIGVETENESDEPKWTLILLNTFADITFLQLEIFLVGRSIPYGSDANTVLNNVKYYEEVSE